MTAGRLARAGAALALAGLALAACTSSRPSLGASVVTTSTVADPSSSATTLAPLSSFPRVLLRIRGADGRVRDVCVYLADTDARQGQGLMGVTDLGGPAGMLFSFTTDSIVRFYMFSTVMPLSIAFFDRAGAFVSATDMAPCPAHDPLSCPTYAADAPYRLALEVPAGGLAPLGLEKGSVVRPGGACAGP